MYLILPSIIPVKTEVLVNILGSKACVGNIQLPAYSQAEGPHEAGDHGAVSVRWVAVQPNRSSTKGKTSRYLIFPPLPQFFFFFMF